MNTKVIEIKSDFKKTISFTIQLVLMLAMITIGILSIFYKDVEPYLFLVLTLNMLILMFNNYFYLKKKHMNYLYLIVAIYTFILFIKGLNG